MKNPKSLLLFLAVFLFLTAAPAALAQVEPATIPCPQNLPCISQETQKSGEAVRETILNKFGGSFLTGFLGLIGATAVVFIIVGGMQMHLALGNEEQIKKGKTTVIWAIAALVISILSVAIVQIISKLNFS